jgi:predicted CoA-binding protein
MMPQTVVVIGASDKPERYSFQAIQLLVSYGHVVIPVHPRLSTIDGLTVVPSLGDIKVPVQTATLYLGKENSDRITSAILDLHPKRLIVNPGAENPDLEEAARTTGIIVLHACTLVLLHTGRF